jgi:ABC-2 type transport system permease protein
VGASFRAESLKLGRRPAVWVLGLIWLFLTVIVGYAVVYVFLVNAPSPPVPEDIPEREREQIQQQEQQFQEDQLRSLLPENLVSSTTPGFATLGGAIALILGTLVVGGEYGWGTLKTIVTQRPNRPQVFGGKLLALWVILVLFVAAVFVGSAAASYVIAGLEGSSVGWPPIGDLARGFGAGVLILTLWAAFGTFLATLFRSTALSVGLGLVYVLVLETLVLSLPIRNEAFQDAREFFPGQNSTFLANSFAEGPFAPPDPPVEPGQAALVVAAYAIIFVIVAAVVFRRRDVA